jgi:hypothetical protein
LIEINTFDDLQKYLCYLPLVITQDIDKRITDWLATGGTLEDSYIKQQYRYASNYLNRTFERSDLN